MNSGISKGTFYYHFENKEDLYLYHLKESVEFKWQYINEFISGQAIDFEVMDLFDKFSFQAKIGMHFSKAYPKYHLLSQMFSKEVGNEIYDKAIQSLSEDSSDVIEPLVTSAIERNELRGEFDSEFIVNTLKHLFSSFDEIIGKDKSIEDSLLELEKLVEFMRYGFKRT